MIKAAEELRVINLDEVKPTPVDFRKPLGGEEAVFRPIGYFDFDRFDLNDVACHSAMFIEKACSILSVIPEGEFVSDEMIKRLPPVSAIYWLYSLGGIEGHLRELLYVGRAENLKTRWNNDRHHCLDRIKAHWCAVYLDWTNVATPWLPIVESALIAVRKPLWNKETK